jgi:ribosome-associated protein
VNTKVRLRWDVARSPSLPEAVRERFQRTYARRITAEGDLLITSQRYRDQVRNIDDCLEKLRELLAAVATPPRRRKKTRPSRASKERRLQGKREQSERKRSRRKPGRDD